MVLKGIHLLSTDHGFSLFKVGIRYINAFNVCLYVQFGELFLGQMLPLIFVP